MICNVVIILLQIALMVWVYVDARDLAARGGMMEGDMPPAAWLVLTFCFGIITFLIYVIAARPGYARNADALEFRGGGSRSSRTADNGRMDCPRCGESIARKAKVCRFCGVELVAESVEPITGTGDWSHGRCGACGKLMNVNTQKCLHCGAQRPRLDEINRPWEEGAKAHIDPDPADRHSVSEADDLDLETEAWDEVAHPPGTPPAPGKKPPPAKPRPPKRDGSEPPPPYTPYR